MYSYHPIVFVPKITWISHSLMGDSLSTWHDVVYYNGTALHIDLEGSLSLRKWETLFPSNQICQKVSQNSPFDQLGTWLGVSSRCEENNFSRCAWKVWTSLFQHCLGMKLAHWVTICTVKVLIAVLQVCCLDRQDGHIEKVYTSSSSLWICHITQLTWLCRYH